MYVYLMLQVMEFVEFGVLMLRDFIFKYFIEWQEVDGDSGYRMFGGKKIFFFKIENKFDNKYFKNCKQFLVLRFKVF